MLILRLETLHLRPEAGYQSVKRVLVNGHPAVILAVAGIAAAAPSIPCKSGEHLKNGLHAKAICLCLYANC